VADRRRPSRREALELLGAGTIFTIVVEGAPQPAIGGRLHIASDGTTTLLTGKVEIGQGCRTLLTQCVAEEMRVPPAKVRVVMGDTALVPDDGGTFASLTTPLAVPVVRQAAAAAREMLRTMKPEEAVQAEIPVKVSLTAPNDWKVLGTPLANVNGRAIVTGAQKYSTDLKASGMVEGRVIRGDAHDSELDAFDAAAAEKLPGVKVAREGSFLGVTAPDNAVAVRAAGSVVARWRSRPLVESAGLFDHFRKTAVKPVANFNTRYPPLLEMGSLEKGFEQAERVHEAVYTLPFIAHVPMEPRAALAWWDETGLTVQGGTQVPFAVRKQLAGAFGLPEQQVRVICCDIGTGFGTKHGGEVMLEAARLAKAAGKPVRVAWTREEEFRYSYCRPAGVIDVRGGLLGEKIHAWDFRNYNSGAASLAVPYSIANYRCAFHRAESPLRQGAYRSLAAVANTFARETHVEDLAALAAADPVEFRLRNLEDTRTREAVQRAAERFGWAKHKGACGMACNIEKGAHMALFAEVEVQQRTVRATRMVMAFDCGAVLNPDSLRNQITGAIIMGLGGALFEELHYGPRGVRSAGFSDYRVPRFSDVPDIDVILIDRREVTPAGAGESPITPVAPALGAAIFAATGKRLRTLPLERGIG
jgi:isoquinoline 1-oxidoreductase